MSVHVLDACISITGQVGEDWALEIEIFGPCEMGLRRKASAISGPKNINRCINSYKLFEVLDVLFQRMKAVPRRLFFTALQ